MNLREVIKPKLSDNLAHKGPSFTPWRVSVTDIAVNNALDVKINIISVESGGHILFVPTIFFWFCLPRVNNLDYLCFKILIIITAELDIHLVQ